jgi:hypothetical protein
MLDFLMLFGVFITVLFMLGLFVVSFILIGHAFIVLVTATSSQALITVLQGLEYLLVAPLPFLLFWALLRYIPKLTRGGGIEGTDHEIRSIKVLMMSLMISVVATELVGKIVSPSTFTFQEAAPRLLTIMVFAAYLLALQLKLS